MKSAIRRFSLVSSSVEIEFEEARARAGLAFDEMIVEARIGSEASRRLSNAQLDRPNEPSVATIPADMPSAPSTIAPPSGPTFGEVYGQYLNDPTRGWSIRTRNSYDTCRRLAVSVIGADLPIRSFSRSHCRDFIEVLRYLPKNASKRFPRLSARQASEKARIAGSTDLISSANANAYLSDFSSFINWAVQEEFLDRNPARGLRLPEEIAKRNRRFPFSASQLQKIFNAPLYRGCRDGERGYFLPGTERPQNARFWIPVIALHTGMRLNEICQLDISDLRKIDDIDCFVITEDSTVGSTDKQVASVNVV